MNEKTFEWLIIAVSAPLAGLGLASLWENDLSIAFLCLGTSLKFAVAYFRTPMNLLKQRGSLSIEEFTKLLVDFRTKLDEEKPMLRWLGEFATWITLGGAVLLTIEALA